MTGPDEELRNILRRSVPPAPGEKLDERVWRAWRKARPLRYRWVPLAAGLILAVGIAAFWPSGSPGRLTTRMDAEGFRPIPNGAITVVKTGENK